MLPSKDQIAATRTALRAGEHVHDLASLIMVAVEDARSLDQITFQPNSDVWLKEKEHEYNTGYSPRVPKCEVCLGGAVLAGSLEMRGDQIEDPYIIIDAVPSPIRNAMSALDDVRRGNIEEALFRVNDPRRHVVSVGPDGRYVLADDKGEYETPIGRISGELYERGEFYSWDAFDSLLDTAVELASAIVEIGDATGTNPIH